ncbi:hypothetical protein BRI9_0298 [plant metagenome]|uniref:Uncharacterized protein n=1 Tax=plant metagenome TaxID=1297885 RepID=A0A484UE50_9ZZZZ
MKVPPRGAARLPPRGAVLVDRRSRLHCTPAPSFHLPL